MIFFKVLAILGLFLLWTFLVYWMHRAAHVRSKYNFLYKLHLSHHRINYLKEENRAFKWPQLFFYFGSFSASLDVLIMLTLPAFMTFAVFPQYGIYILAFHYIYEVFLSEGTLDHNPKIKGKVTRFFAWGEYHLSHHEKWNCNYGLTITFWDLVFGTKQNK